MKKSIFILCVCSAIFVGCALDDVVERSDTKCEAEYTEVNGLICHLNAQNDEDPACSEGYRNAMKIGFCPKNLETCAEDANGVSYCHVTCNSGQVYCNGGCIDPSTDMKYCGSKGYCFSDDMNSDDYQGAKCADGTTCSSGKCHASTACGTNQHEDETGVCIDNSVEMCGTQSCTALPGWKTGKCDINKCVVTECQASYHIDSRTGLCAADTSECCGLNCDNCGDGSCSRGKCVTGKACNLGQHLDRNKECEDDTLENCGRIGYNCHLFGLKEGECIEGMCIAESCDDSFHLNDGICIPDTTTCCGENCLDCGANACVKGACSSSGCSRDQHVDPGTGTCVDNSVLACGTYNNNCTNIPGWLVGECNLGKCEASECDVEYHIDPDKKLCAADNAACCGKSCISCGNKEACVLGVCTQLECDPGEHQNSSGDCVADTKNACGPRSIDCATNILHAADVECRDTQCYAKECDSDYHLSEDSKTCLEDSANACGSYNNNCFTDNVVNAVCESGKCKVTACKPTYHINSAATGCNLNTDTDCGSDGNKCPADTDTTNNYCDVSGGKCAFSCRENYHINYGKTGCDADSIYNCGAYDNSCLKKEGWEHAGCYKGNCVAVSCKNGYYLANIGGYASCEKAQTNQCGPYNCNEIVDDFWGDKQCKTNGIHFYCEASSYDTCSEKGGDAHESGGFSCVETYDNSRWGVNCNYIEHRGCYSKSHSPKPCLSGQHSYGYGSGCEDDSVSKCGSDRNNCEYLVPGWKNGECKNTGEGAVCSATECKDGYIRTDIGAHNIYRCKPNFDIQ